MVYKLRKSRRIINDWAKEHFHIIKETNCKLLEELLVFENMEENIV